MLRTRSFRWAVVLHALLAALLSATPLFNLLGYEHALVVGWLAAFTAPWVGAEVARGERHAGEAVVWPVVALLPGLMVILANAVRVTNCNVIEGLKFFLLLPVANAAIGGAIGFLIGSVGASSRGPRASRNGGLRSLLLLGVPLSFVICAAWQFYAEPSIVIHSHILGYFAGSLYDEHVIIDRALLGLRAVTVLWVLGLLWLARGRNKVTALLAVMVVLCIDNVAGEKTGYQHGRAAVEAALPTRVERPGVVIHLPAGVAPETAKAIADDHVFRLKQLEKKLDLKFQSTLHSYVYRSAAEKALLMGARDTYFAKPWLSEIHIHGFDVPHPQLAHELAHVVAAEFGSALLKISARYEVWPNMGLVEGLAEALSPPTALDNNDDAARAMMALGRAPDMVNIIQPTGFWRQAPGRAYTVAGSFIAYLMQQHGPEPLKRVYRRGDFQEVYGVSLAELVDRWTIWLNVKPTTTSERSRVDSQTRQPAIFQRTCAHEIARLRTAAAKALPENAVRVYETIVEHLPADISAKVDLALAKRRAGHTTDFLKDADALLDGQDISPQQRDRLQGARGDALWELGKLDGAAADANAIRERSSDPATRRLMWVKHWSLKQPAETQQALRDKLVKGKGDEVYLVTLEALAAARPHDTTPSYLVGRALHTAHAWEPAVARLKLATKHPDPEIASEAWRLTAECYFWLHRYEPAAEAMQHHLDVAPTSGDKARAADWLERIAWTAAEAPTR